MSGEQFKKAGRSRLGCAATVSVIPVSTQPWLGVHTNIMLSKEVLL